MTPRDRLGHVMQSAHLEDANPSGSVLYLGSNLCWVYAASGWYVRVPEVLFLNPLPADPVFEIAVSGSSHS
jgi:hypothetical protein